MHFYNTSTSTFLKGTFSSLNRFVTQVLLAGSMSQRLPKTFAVCESNTSIPLSFAVYSFGHNLLMKRNPVALKCFMPINVFVF